VALYIAIWPEFGVGAARTIRNSDRRFVMSRWPQRVPLSGTGLRCTRFESWRPLRRVRGADDLRAVRKRLHRRSDCYEYVKRFKLSWDVYMRVSKDLIDRTKR